MWATVSGRVWYYRIVMVVIGEFDVLAVQHGWSSPGLGRGASKGPSRMMVATLGRPQTSATLDKDPYKYSDKYSDNDTYKEHHLEPIYSPDTPLAQAIISLLSTQRHTCDSTK